jgi:HlyD family secretion protein
MRKTMIIPEKVPHAKTAPLEIPPVLAAGSTPPQGASAPVALDGSPMIASVVSDPAQEGASSNNRRSDQSSGDYSKKLAAAPQRPATSSHGNGRRHMKWILIVLAALSLIGAAGGGVWYLRNGHVASAFRTVAIQRGDMVVTVNATGTVQPEKLVNVGAQIAGQITGFGPDPRDKNREIDYGSPVEKGTVLALIDDAVYQVQVKRAKADLARAKADLLQLQSKEKQAERDWQRLKPLNEKGVISDAEFETADTAFVFAKSARAVGEAAVAQADAALEQAQINLGFCTITSPVKGVIVDRRVNVGQTVVASLNSPSLFLIAKDLSRLQVWASVNEADVGRIVRGKDVQVTFAVDAFPRTVFHGTVVADQPRLNAAFTQNVVTYTVVVDVTNAEGETTEVSIDGSPPAEPQRAKDKLLPYMTANLQFTVARRNSVLVVPNAALRFRPDPDDVVEDAREEYRASQRRGGAAADASSAGQGHSDQGIVWIVEDDYLRPIPVRLGETDGARTEIITDELKEKDHVVTGVNQQIDDTTTKNPFMPQLRGRRKQ